MAFRSPRRATACWCSRARSCPSRRPEQPCIRCMACAEACPARLLPQELLRRLRARQWAEAERAGLADCIECGCCDLVCPSRIPLLDWLRYGRAELRRRGAEERRAAEARARHEARKARLAREAAEREARRRAQLERLRDPEAVAALLAAARERRGGEERG
ncbi:MAG: 4Fe-4S dicluster domain-containing protein [Xanthomonadales bacterium]|nr:4Fe-4S dicluster domain-containing protein [Xanthomonadales bacterium]